MDASTLLTQSIDWVHSTQQTEHSEHVFYFMKGQWAAGMNSIENWFLAAIPRTEFMLHWTLEWEFILVNFAGSGIQYVGWLWKRFGFQDTLRAEGFLNKIHKIGLINYLSGYMAARKVVLIDGVVPNAAYLDADESALKLSRECFWMNGCFVEKLITQPEPKSVSPLIKIVNSQRQAIISYMEKPSRLIHPQSIVSKYL